VGIGLVVFALLAMLSVWFGAAGPAGRAISSVLRGTFGVAAFLVPPAGAYWGVLLLRDTAREERMRMLVGFAAVTAGALGIASLVRGNPSAFGGYEAVGRAAGILGALAAHPASRVISTIGAAVVGVVVLVLFFLGPRE